MTVPLTNVIYMINERLDAIERRVGLGKYAPYTDSHGPTRLTSDEYQRKHGSASHDHRVLDTNNAKAQAFLKTHGERVQARNNYNK
jgi:hypothetical protein